MTAVLHQPVLLQFVIDGLNVRQGKAYLDCTVGSGGHAVEIAKRGGRVYGLDVDPEALKRAQERLGPEAKLLGMNFSHLQEAAGQFGLKTVAGVLLDLGLSSEQIADPARGFSFQADGPLDMRSDPNLGVSAADLVNGLGRSELIKLFRLYGEERWAIPIAKAIMANRPLTTTFQLAELIAGVVKTRDRRHHPATQVFQALRMAVNDELNNLKAVLPQAVELLETGGRLAVISFHSLEDRIVKNFMKENKDLSIINKKPIISAKPRAMLRVADKL
ncbi:16S rRNA (cytosine(1402)-N(4))-methyltransferase [Candidatus Beckwithbacteria bacterium RIFCSPLOWO2_02_FULL_47_23]|uniref:Ribosomal RNA small subunit methyltransferase H n=2 Tax=Candidatus Beckwithiibacteriota TaxID=1752726 RepID=A0A1F5E333_9BACT|nr:MAG: 16S rRNA (cytosine(1402)-N(4))-methyltransferase [Candidatus Beckwithbacteria bacterium RIFCSPHIGHO2_12_FULL_47_17]OGD61792.1 MAG: 16S rRNA (cytosine(1402)-N(4))-methyltransferase [Candidatus Beckwithbacteria bacterium RIFCSPLOWO2_02_FULL_47_23]